MNYTCLPASQYVPHIVNCLKSPCHVVYTYTWTRTCLAF